MSKKIFWTDVKDLPLDQVFPAFSGAEFVIHTAHNDWPARFERKHQPRGSLGEIFVRIYPLGELVILKDATGRLWLIDPATGGKGRDRIVSITSNAYDYTRKTARNPGRQHLPCGDLPAKKCRQLQDIYESARSRGYSKRRSAKQARGVVSKSSNSEELGTWIVDYSVGTYSGTVEVRASVDADRDHVIALARQQLRRRSDGFLPFGAESWRVRRDSSEHNPSLATKVRNLKK